MAQEYVTYYVKTVKTGLYATMGGGYTENRNGHLVHKFDNYDAAREYAKQRTENGNWQWTVEECDE